MAFVNALFVHGMGRSSLAWLPTLVRFRANGINSSTFGYSTTIQDFSSIVNRLVKVLVGLSTLGDYVVIGHSLGGVLLRAAIDQLPAGTPLPKQLFLLGSPISPPRMAKHLQKNFLFQAIARDCGHLLASAERMMSIPIPRVPCVAIIGTRGVCEWLIPFTPFGREPNDCIVAVSEASAEWLSEKIYVPAIHTLLPSSRQVSEIVLARIIPPHRRMG